LSYERWDFADFGGFWYKSGGRTTGVGVQAGNRVSEGILSSQFPVGLQNSFENSLLDPAN